MRLFARTMLRGVAGPYGKASLTSCLQIQRNETKSISSNTKKESVARALFSEDVLLLMLDFFLRTLGYSLRIGT